MIGIGPRLCLNMIVKNEATVIRRCIDSVRAICDYWVIVDTGSTDGTQQIICDYLRDIPGELHQRPWRDFASNRSEALELARGKADYTLIMDADDTLDAGATTSLAALGADSYMIEIIDAQLVYRRIQLVRNALPWRYEGVLHEFLSCEGAGAPALLLGIKMHRNHDGARRKDPETYLRDVTVLEAALRSESNAFLLARYRFYLAQSYRDCGELRKALEHYLARAELGFWHEEVFVSLYSAAQLKERLGHPDEDVLAAYLRAADVLPTRAEALHGASRFCRRKKRYEEGYRIAKRGLQIRTPSSDVLFLEPWIYEIGLLDEFSLNAYWAGWYRESLDAALTVLATGKLSAPDTRRVVANARVASEKLSGNHEPRTNDDFVQQHPLTASLRSAAHGAQTPRVLVAILASQSAAALPLYLRCIEALDYPKSSIVLYIRPYDSTEATEHLLRDWMSRVGSEYAGAEFVEGSGRNQTEPSASAPSSEVNFRVPGGLCKSSLSRAADHGCAFCFVANVGTFLRRCTLRSLVALNLPIVAPFLRSVSPADFYSNYHAEIDANGYFKDCDQYVWSLNRWVRGILEMPVVNLTYLVRADVIGDLVYEDGTARHEYVIFSASARARGTPQYLDNRQVYGYHTYGVNSDQRMDDVISRATTLLKADLLDDEVFA